LQFLALAPGHGLERRAGDLQRPDHVAVDDGDAPRGDRPHGELLVARNAELAHEEHVERRAERPRHLEPDGDAPPWRGQDRHVGPPRVLPHLLGQRLPGVAAVAERLLVRHGRPPTPRGVSRRRPRRGARTSPDEKTHRAPAGTRWGCRHRAPAPPAVSGLPIKYGARPALSRINDRPTSSIHKGPGVPARRAAMGGSTAPAARSPPTAPR